MKKNIHPKYKRISAFCACGNVINTKSTLVKESINLDICNMCHPFYTGTQRIIDTKGRVNLFKKRFYHSTTDSFLFTNQNNKK